MPRLALRRAAAFLLALLILAPFAAAAQNLPLPRFASMRNSESNVRAGPGMQYPIEWVFTRSGLPVEIIAEFDNWRQIRDWEGVGGWVHHTQLTGARSVVVRADGASLHPVLYQPRPDSGLVAQAEPGALGRILECPAADEPGGAYCRLDFAGLSGWMSRDSLWGVYPGEAVD